MQCKVLLYICLLTVIKQVSPTEVKSRLNTEALLPCTVPLSHPINQSLIEVSWKNNGSDIASFRNTSEHIEDGFSWDTSQFVDGNFSLNVLKATLGLQGTYLCTVSYNSTALLSNNVTLSVLVPPDVVLPPQWVVLEKESRLECLAEGFYPPPVSFSWTRDGNVIHPAQPADAEHTPDGLYRAVGNLTFYPSQDDQNVTFGCRVTHADVQEVLEFQLNITFLPAVSLSAMPSSRDAPLTLYCDLEGFYPEEVSVSWLQNGSVLPEPPVTEQGPDGSYRTRRYYTLSPEERSQAGEVGCVVNQPGVTEPVYSSAQLEDLDPPDRDPVLTKSAKASVALMCISLVLVFLLCFGFSWRRRDEKQKSLSVSGIILPPRTVVGQKGRVTVSIEGRRVDRVQTAWFLNDTPISDTSFTVSEKGPLLPSRGEMGYYKLHTQGPLHSSGTGCTQQLLSALTFIPQISIHKGAVFKCQVSYMGKDKVVVERVSERFTILAAPEVSEIQLAETAEDSDIISMTIAASRFHPDVITFRWFCQGGELSPVASQALTAPRPDAEGFFSASSQCKLPRGELEKGGTKVWVSVHHVALKQPVTRETRGFIKKPRVSDIVSSASSPGQPLTLGCDITGFYPPDISVTWLELRDGERDDREEEVLEGGEVWGPVQTPPGLYRATATLRRGGGGAKEEKRERGGGVVCRVEHCSLDEPMERRWRNIDITVPSIPSSISVCWSSEGVGVFSLLMKGGHPRVQVLWVAGGHALSPLVSSETEELGDDGQRELKSVCAVERSTRRPSRTDKQPETRRNGRAMKTRDAVMDPDMEGIEYIDEKVDEENNNTERWEVMKTTVEEESEEEQEERPGALHINTVNLRRRPGGDEAERLRVCVEIKHPGLQLPVYRTWTEPIEEVSS